MMVRCAVVLSRKRRSVSNRSLCPASAMSAAAPALRRLPHPARRCRKIKQLQPRVPV